ncbi:MAG: DUF1552 domain-containing protein [Polyangiaceae bacterium]|nr:DUF1552 domain-containing protein [Polyangiaceae bacterium]
MKPIRVSRRHLLRGFGAGSSVCLGLPILDAMLTDNGLLRTAHGQTNIPVNLLTFFIPNGVVPDAWWPVATGSAYELTRSLVPIAEFRQDFSIIQGLRKQEALRNQSINNDAHQRGHASFATGGSLASATTVEFASMDQVAAGELGKMSRFKSLPVALGGLRGEVADQISWQSGATPVPAERDAAVLFEKLFGKPAVGVADYRQSVLDYVRVDVTDLSAQISHADKHRLDEYLTSVRELEARLALPITSTAECNSEMTFDGRLGGSAPDIDNMSGAYSNEHAQLLIRLQVMAFACGFTRVGSFMLASRGNKRQFPWLNLVDELDGHHGISHLESPEGIEAQTKIVVDEMEQFAYGLRLMKAAMQGATNLLDNSLVFFASECGLGVSHDFSNVPVIVAGHAGGKLKLGQHVRYASAQRANYDDLLLTILNIVGVPATKFGVYGTKLLPELA